MTIQAKYCTHVARHTVLSSVATRTAKFATLRTSFNFPPSLKFATISGFDPNAAPHLAYNTENKPVFAHEDTLVKLLQVLDAINSGGK